MSNSKRMRESKVRKSLEEKKLAAREVHSVRERREVKEEVERHVRSMHIQ